MCSLINKQLLLAAYAYLFIMGGGQQGSEALQVESGKGALGAGQGALGPFLAMLDFEEGQPKELRDFVNKQPKELRDFVNELTDFKKKQKDALDSRRKRMDLPQQSASQLHVDLLLKELGVAVGKDNWSKSIQLAEDLLRKWRAELAPKDLKTEDLKQLFEDLARGIVEATIKEACAQCEAAKAQCEKLAEEEKRFAEKKLSQAEKLAALEEFSLKRQKIYEDLWAQSRQLKVLNLGAKRDGINDLIPKIAEQQRKADDAKEKARKQADDAKEKAAAATEKRDEARQQKETEAAAGGKNSFGYGGFAR